MQTRKNNENEPHVRTCGNIFPVSVLHYLYRGAPSLRPSCMRVNAPEPRKTRWLARRKLTAAPSARSGRVPTCVRGSVQTYFVGPYGRWIFTIHLPALNKIVKIDALKKCYSYKKLKFMFACDRRRCTPDFLSGGLYFRCSIFATCFAWCYKCWDFHRFHPLYT